ncbi:MAG: hypothetical protein OXH28_04585 [bacterium]|nr:hypothetical protein [bacterium]MXV91007.1 hypothetical protein [Acidimicrobiia bacterium]MYC44582.1 hypothetical protein [Acidimicrobiia bacterium]MYI19745.1 hypothetical protein [Acidimicrobiia bacterium]MYI56814.1 hypothetical protein [Acidimicrobiia bacterium]
MPGRHRLTITVTMPLYEQLCELAGPRRISQWMEDAAWHKIRALRGGGAPTASGAGGLPGDPVPVPELPPPPWRWSPLRPPEPQGGLEGGADLVDL